MDMSTPVACSLAIAPLDEAIPVKLSADEIERLSQVVERFRQAKETSATGPDQIASFARFLIWSQKRRGATLQELDNGDPVWDMILDLYVAQAEQRRVSVSSLCLVGALPPTTALRRVQQLVEAGHFLRSKDLEDGRRIYLELSPSLLGKVELHLLEIRRRALGSLL